MNRTIVPVIPVFFLSRQGKAFSTGERTAMGCIGFPFFMFFRTCGAIQPVSCRGFLFQGKLSCKDSCGNSVNDAVTVN
ncbi:hypothetical protein [Akkermansia sp.]|uniref:hypothetical protein n=1 Tax=Akkermansia sp. TaxID=1872421 RepID=UPI0025C4EFC3|nr:hypothetical protein [Akkermansia sp.]MCD8064093.1 hypothetical protein [Akkermansia sp.]